MFIYRYELKKSVTTVTNGKKTVKNPVNTAFVVLPFFKKSVTKR